MNAESYIKVLEQHMLHPRQHIFQGRPCVFQQDNAKPHTAALTTAWLCSRRVQVLNCSACSPALLPIENIWCNINKKNTSKTTNNYSAAGNLYRARMGPNSNTKKTEIHNLDSQTSSNSFEKKMLHHGKHAPVPTILKPVAGITFEMSSFCAYIYIYAFSRRFYPKRLTVHSGYTFFASMCVPWELNPQTLCC